MAGAASEGLCPSDLPNRAACPGATPSYRRDVAPILEQRCATCHYPGNTQSGDVFADYDDVYSLRQTVLTRIYGCVMPPDGAPPLTSEQRQILLHWLTCGAPDN